MRRAMLVVALVALLAPLTATAATAASRDDAWIATPRDPIVSGAVLASADGGAIVIEGTRPHDEIRLSAARVTGEVVVVTMEAVETPLGDVGMRPRYERHRVDAEDATVTFGHRQRGFVLVASADTGAGHVRVDAPAMERATTTLEDADAAAYVYGMGADAPFAYAYRPDADTLTFDSSHLRLGAAGFDARAAGRLDLFAVGAVLTVESAEGRVTHVLGEGSERPLGMDASPYRVDRYAYAVLELADADASVASSAGARVRILLPTPTLEVDGGVSFRDATGHVRTRGQRLDLAHSAVALEGALSIRALGADDVPPSALAAGVGSRAFAVSGTFDNVVLGSLAAATSLQRTDVAVVAVAGLALAAVARLVGAAGVSALYTRIPTSRVLAHDERRRLLDVVRARPGLHLRALERAVGFRWGQLTYHVRVLKRARLVQTERSGRFVHVFPAEGQRGHAPEAVLNARGAARRIYDLLSCDGGLSQDQIRARLGISVQLVSHHLRRLERDGLVCASGAAPRRYRRAR